jgi:hypothetical protein
MMSTPTTTTHTNLIIPKSKNRLLGDFCSSFKFNDIKVILLLLVA